jgi:signal transduction histidine kinase
MADVLPAASRLAMLAVAAAGLAWAIVAIVAVDPGARSFTSYAAARPLAHAIDITAGLGLVLVGLFAWIQPQSRRLGLLALLVGVAWFGSDIEGWEHGVSLVRSLGPVAASFGLALTLHLTLALPDGRLRSPQARAAVAVAYAFAAAVSVGRALFRDPLLDLYCWRNCNQNAFLIHASRGAARTLDDLWLWSALVVAIGVVGVAAARLLVASGPGRRRLLPVLGPALIVGASEATYAVALLHDRLERPTRDDFAAIFLSRGIAYATLALGVAWTVARVLRNRAQIARLATELGDAPPPGKLREALRTALGDPGLDVVYPRGASRQLIDADGRPAVAPGSGLAVARVMRHERPLAFVLHDAALVDDAALERAFGSAARLAVENESLRAQALAQVQDLRDSRARIVAAGDAERRRLERDLHDGAQQRLLALSYDLRLARANAVSTGDNRLVALLDIACDETGAALDQLRDLAHGIYPAVLTEAGLAPALETLADAAPLPVELGEVEATRHSPAVERTAYLIVAEAIDDAADRDARFVSAQIRREDDVLAITVDDDGAPRNGVLQHLADRVGALGGELDIGATSLRAELPCV